MFNLTRPPIPPPREGPSGSTAAQTKLHKHDRKVSINVRENDDIVQYSCGLILKREKEITYTRTRNAKKNTN
jgi:hypothetical protein